MTAQEYRSWKGKNRNTGGACGQACRMLGQFYGVGWKTIYACGIHRVISLDETTRRTLLGVSEASVWPSGAPKPDATVALRPTAEALKKSVESVDRMLALSARYGRIKI